MSIEIATGLPGAGKSAYTAWTGLMLMQENKRYWEKKGGMPRTVSPNMRYCKSVEEEYGLADQGGIIQYWDDPLQVSKMTDTDVIWEEMGAHCDSRQWENMPIELKRFFQQHRHRGVNIYANVQEFADIDVSIRRLTSNLVYLTKIAGSPDPGPNRPPIKYIWGLVLKTYLDPIGYKEMEKFKNADPVPGLFWIDEEKVSLYDMRNDIQPGKYPPLRHIERHCGDPKCQFHKTIHV